MPCQYKVIFEWGSCNRFIFRALREETAKREQIERLREQQEQQLLEEQQKRQDLEEFKLKQAEELEAERRKLMSLEREKNARKRELEVRLRSLPVFISFTIRVAHFCIFYTPFSSFRLKCFSISTDNLAAHCTKPVVAT